jgi:hypothetical protein
VFGRQVPVDAFGERIAAAGLGCRDGPVEVAGPGRHRRGKDGVDERVLRGEVVVEAAARQPGRAHRLVEADRLDAAVTEQAVRDGDDRFSVLRSLLLRVPTVVPQACPSTGL